MISDREDNSSLELCALAKKSAGRHESAIRLGGYIGTYLLQSLGCRKVTRTCKAPVML